MEEQQEETKPTNQPALCEECKLNPWKYRCPGCSIRSCGLLCVKAHKDRTGCTGKRQLTHFVPLSQFDDNRLLSDYNMLEEVKRVAESAQRMRLKLCGYSNFRLPYPLKSLQTAAACRRTKLIFHSRGMFKRERNQSFYNNRKKFISWTIEWQFHLTDVTLLDHGVNENTNLCSVIEKHLEPGPWKHQLRQFCEVPLDSLNFFIRKYPKGPKSPFRELNIKAPIKEQLAHLVILEHPIIHVFLPSHGYDFEVLKDKIPHNIELKDSESNNEPSPKGVIFREEEIEDDNSTDPQVLDLLQLVNSDAISQNPHQDRGTRREFNNVSLRPLLDDKPILTSDICIQKPEGENISTSSKNEESGLFDFDQGLIDDYSDLIAQTNPDDFLDLDGVFAEGLDMEGQIEDANFGGQFMEDELEEGEIPNC